MTGKNRYIEELEARLGDLTGNIEELQRRAREAGKTGQETLKREVERLQEQRGELQGKLEQARYSGTEALDDVKSGLERAWSDLKSGIDNAFERFK